MLLTSFPSARMLTNLVAKVEGGRFPDMIAVDELLGELELAVESFQGSQRGFAAESAGRALIERKLRRLYLLANEFKPPVGCSKQYAQAIDGIEQLTADIEQELGIKSPKE